MFCNGVVERQKNASNVSEFRLSKNASKQISDYATRIQHDAHHCGFVRKCDYKDMRSFRLAAKKLVESGLLVPEPDGNFTLNPNIKTERKNNECS
jgi:hypothetical protein